MPNHSPTSPPWWINNRSSVADVEDSILCATKLGVAAAAHRYKVPISTIHGRLRDAGVVLVGKRRPTAKRPPRPKRPPRLATETRRCPPHYWDTNNPREWSCLKCGGRREIPPPTYAEFQWRKVRFTLQEDPNPRLRRVLA